MFRRVEALATRVKSLRIDHSQNGDADMGPLITAAHRERVVGFIHVGTPTLEAPERERPDPTELLTEWAPA